MYDAAFDFESVHHLLGSDTFGISGIRDHSVFFLLQRECDIKVIRFIRRMDL